MRSCNPSRSQNVPNDTRDSRLGTDIRPVQLLIPGTRWAANKFSESKERRRLFGVRIGVLLISPLALEMHGS